MKRILLYTVILLSGCQKDITAEDNYSEKTLLLNLTLDGMPVAETRSASVDADMNTIGFYLAGYHTEGHMEGSADDAYPNVFDYDIKEAQAPVPLVKKSGGKFTLRTIKWALDETTYLSFFGWSQGKVIPTSGVTSATSGILAYTKGFADKGYPWIDIRNADAPADQTDVVGSRSLDHANDAVLSAVDLDFYHLLSKLTFKAKSSSQANIVFTAVNLIYATNKVYKKARYTFGNDVTALGSFGSLTEYQHGTVSLGASLPTMTGGAEVELGCGMLIPQALAAGDVSLELKYKLSPNSGDVSGVEQTKTLPLSAFTFVQGKNYVYTIDVQATGIFVMPNPVITPWADSGTSLPVVVGPRGDALLILDGYDKPHQHTDGKRYWLDRSGYNRHVMLGGGFASYDATKHGYVFTGAADKGSAIPDIGVGEEITLDMILEGKTGGTYGKDKTSIPVIFYEGTTPKIWPNVSFQAAARVNLNRNNSESLQLSNFSNVAETDRLTYWTFMVTPALYQIYYNGSLKGAQSYTGTAKIGNLNSGKLAEAYDGRISYLKVTRRERTVKDIVVDYKNYAKRFNIVELPSKYLPPVTDGLVFCFDGRSGVETINGVKYWRDQVGKNDAKVIGTVPYTNNYFSVTGTNYLSMIYNVALSNNNTVEIVLKPQGRYEGQPIFWGTSTTNGSSGRLLAMHFPYSTGQIYVDSPGEGDRYFSNNWPSGFGSQTALRQIAIRRRYSDNKSEFFMYNRVALSGGAKTDISTTECLFMDMGGHNWSGDFYAVRFYNRALTDAEMALNYQFDKTNYSFTDDK